MAWECEWDYMSISLCMWECECCLTEWIWQWCVCVCVCLCVWAEDFCCVKQIYSYGLRGDLCANPGGWIHEFRNGMTGFTISCTWFNHERFDKHFFQFPRNHERYFHIFSFQESRTKSFSRIHEWFLFCFNEFTKEKEANSRFAWTPLGEGGASPFFFKKEHVLNVLFLTKNISDRFLNALF